MPDPRPAPDVYDALFGDLPEGWRERKGLPPQQGSETGARSGPAASASGDSEVTSSDAEGPPRIPGAPESPWQLSWSSWVAVAKRTVSEIGRDRVTSVSGGVTFFGLLALFPAITALVSIYGWVADRQTISENINLLARFLPASAVELIATQIESIVSAPKTALSLAGIVSIVLALWTANGGMKALIAALNVAWFETERRGFIRLNVVSLAMTLGAIVMVILLISAITVLPAVLKIIAAGSVVEDIVNLLRWPFMLAVLLLALAVLYRFGPSKENPEWHWVTPGAILASLGLVVASLLFSWYVANFANYNETYGSLGAAVVLMMWLWIASMVVMVGAELNSEAERQIKLENGVPLEDSTDKK
ncbi:YihY/virulence factor BrkB family protein [uncultured Paracoccus sp.]|uniref:YihY/virulence factor BrkB family protein n=1 Tax=uncultured Paracoccus sp. TaxID=189685 RepID=UPI002621EE29|nr:YihY/virulence factor BrkB family protein [uncultured Paracoccus sp.]